MAGDLFAVYAFNISEDGVIYGRPVVYNVSKFAENETAE